MKKTNEILTHRHDVLLHFDVTNGNPNGDPDMGNMPRQIFSTQRGIVTDVCLKRKIRNAVEISAPERIDKNTNDYKLLIRQGAVINDEIDNGVEKSDKKLPPGASKSEKQEATMKWLCREFFDVRAFGGVLSTGNALMKGSAWGQVRGPVQVTFGQSYHPIIPMEISITRMAVTTKEDAKKKEREMGNKHIVPYALYAAKVYVSPAFAERTGFTNADLGVIFDALGCMFEHDRSAARGEMVVRGIYDFEHVGTQHENNAEQNRREARLGCTHAHKLFEGIEVKLKDGVEFPASFADYEVKCRWDNIDLPAGVRLNKRHE